MKRGKTEAETLKLNGWGVGDILEGSESGRHDRILITGVGDTRFMCRWDNGSKGKFGEERGNTVLSAREWRKVVHEPVWLGPLDGNPLPGTECAVFIKSNDTTVCKNALITYQGDGFFCYKNALNGNEYSVNHRDYGFKPIVLERNKAVEQMQRDLEFVADTATKDAFGRLYDKGWRKLVSRAEAEDRIRLNPSYTATEILNAIGYWE